MTLGMGVSVTRTQLGLPVLNINDHNAYYVADTFLGGQMAWNRNQVTSPYVDGSVTVNRTRSMVTEQIVVEVLGGPSQALLQANVATLIAAFSQDSYLLSITLPQATTYQYLCEAADYQVSWTSPRFFAKQLQVTFSMPRQPIALVGGV